MNPRLRSSVLLIITLIIGMVLGALVQSSFRDQRLKRVMIMRNETGFIAAIEEAIDPRDETQAFEVHKILEEATPRIFSQFRQSREQVHAEIETMKTQLLPLLDVDQQERLAQRFLPPHPRKEKMD